MDTSVLLRWYFAFVLPILEYCSPVWGPAAECYLELIERQVYSVARLCSDQSIFSLCHWRNFAGLSMLHKVNSNSNHCLFSELPSASTRVRHTGAAVAAHPLEWVDGSRCRTSQFARCFLPAQVRMWNCLPDTVFDTGTLAGWARRVHADNRWLLPWVVFYSVFRAQVLVGLLEQLTNNYVFLTGACTDGFNNNNNNNNNNNVNPYQFIIEYLHINTKLSQWNEPAITNTTVQGMRHAYFS